MVLEHLSLTEMMVLTNTQGWIFFLWSLWYEYRKNRREIELNTRSCFSWSLNSNVFLGKAAFVLESGRTDLWICNAVRMKPLASA